jgi:hypothetical protein
MANNTQNRNQPRNEQGEFESKRRFGRQTNKQGPGRGWHGDSEGHARAGSQSHKNK